MKVMPMKLDNVREQTRTEVERQYDAVVRFSFICRNDRHFVWGSSCSKVDSPRNHSLSRKELEIGALGTLIAGAIILVTIVFILIGG